jgi:hypothetical protein
MFRMDRCGLVLMTVLLSAEAAGQRAAFDGTLRLAAPFASPETTADDPEGRALTVWGLEWLGVIAAMAAVYVPVLYPSWEARDTLGGALGLALGVVGLSPIVGAAETAAAYGIAWLLGRVRSDPLNLFLHSMFGMFAGWVLVGSGSFMMNQFRVPEEVARPVTYGLIGVAALVATLFPVASVNGVLRPFCEPPRAVQGAVITAARAR